MVMKRLIFIIAINFVTSSLPIYADKVFTNADLEIFSKKTSHSTAINSQSDSALAAEEKKSEEKIVGTKQDQLQLNAKDELLKRIHSGFADNFLLNSTKEYSDNFSEGYQNAKWGMTIEQVKASFPGMDFKMSNEGVLYFFSKIAEENVAINFVFTEAKLCRVVVVVQIETRNEENYIAKFNKFESLLNKKYYETESTMRQGSKDGYTEDARAISRGEGGYWSGWETQESTIGLELSGDNLDMNLRIIYESKVLKEIAIKNDEQNALGQL